MPNLDAMIATLGALCGRDPALLPARPPMEAFFEGRRRLEQQADDLFGPLFKGRHVRIIVTLRFWMTC